MKALLKQLKQNLLISDKCKNVLNDQLKQRMIEEVDEDAKGYLVYCIPHQARQSHDEDMNRVRRFRENW